MDERERREKLEKLARLDKIYIHVIYYRLLDKTVPDIAEILNISTKTAYTRFTRIFEELQIEGEEKEEQLTREYSPIFFEFFKSEADLANWGHVRAEMIRQATALGSQSAPVVETPDIAQSELPNPEAEEKPEGSDSMPERSDAQDSQTERPVQPIARQPATRPPWLLPAISVFVLCLLCSSALIFAARMAPALFGRDLTPTEILATEAPTNATAPLPTETQPVLPSETSLPTSTETSIPATPTFPSPTLTSQPTESVTPLPPALFETDFESGFPAGMEYVRENLDIVEGELVAHDYTLLGFGDGTWKNYQVEYEARKHTYCFGLQNNGVAAHAIDPENMVMWSWNYCEAGWFEIVNGDWNLISQGDNIANPGTMVKIRLVAENGNFTVYVNNNKYSSYFNEKYTQGKAYILVTDSSVIDNIRISQLP